jgi:hypothetical protein
MHAWQYLGVSIMMNSSLHDQGVSDRPATGEEMVSAPSLWCSY